MKKTIALLAMAWSFAAIAQMTPGRSVEHH